MNQPEINYREKVKFHVWRNGADPELIPFNRLGDAFRKGDDFDDFVRIELKRQATIKLRSN